MNDQTAEPAQKNEPRGVGGWLLLFCFGQVVIAPGTAMRSISSLWEKIGPHPYPVARQLAVINTCEIIFIAVYGFVVGVLIWRGSKRGRTIARQYLIVRIILDVGVFALVVAWANYGFGQIAARKMAAAVGPMMSLEIGVILLWFAYFTYSKRVRNTYQE
jgi:hypothetical protein